MQKNAPTPKKAAPGPRTKAAGVTKKATAAANAAKKTKAAAAKEKAAAAAEKKAAAAEKKKKATAASNEKKKQQRKAAAKEREKELRRNIRDAPVSWSSSSSSSVSGPPPTFLGGGCIASPSPSFSSVSSTRDPITQCGGVWTQEMAAARDAEREVLRKAAKAKVAKQQAQSKGPKLSAANLRKAEERELWMMEKMERKRKSFEELVEFVAGASDHTVYAMRVRELEQDVPCPREMKLYNERLKGVDTEELDKRSKWSMEVLLKDILAGSEKEEDKKKKKKKKKASPKKASPKKASPKKKTT